MGVELRQTASAAARPLKIERPSAGRDLRPAPTCPPRCARLPRRARPRAPGARPRCFRFEVHASSAACVRSSSTEKEKKLGNRAKPPRCPGRVAWPRTCSRSNVRVRRRGPASRPSDGARVVRDDRDDLRGGRAPAGTGCPVRSRPRDTRSTGPGTCNPSTGRDRRFRIPIHGTRTLRSRSSHDCHRTFVQRDRPRKAPRNSEEPAARAVRLPHTSRLRPLPPSEDWMRARRWPTCTRRPARSLRCS